MSCKVGVEIECEGVEDVKEHPLWKFEREEMLRGGAEYVLRSPLKGASLKRAVIEMTKLLDVEKFTQRCSTHIHIDVRDMNRVQRMNFITLYIMFERVLLSLVEENRVGNLFCLPAFDSNSLEEVLYDVAIKNLELKDLSLEGWKYSAINLASIGRLGSLEFRALHGTKDPKEIMNWIDLHLCMQEYAMGEGLTPESIAIASSAKGFTGIFEEVFGELSKQFVHLDLEELIREGVQIVQFYAFTGDWT
tara:strand:+ start:78 stop:821 length:744 start_codon:yes stop_codon:yes gene_type:complete